MMQIGFVSPEQVPETWGIVQPLIESALARSAGEQSADDVRDRLIAGESALALGHDGRSIRAAFVMNIVYYPRFGGMRVVLAAGEPMADWLPALVSVLETECARLGLEQIEFFGRPGFTRALQGIADHQYHVMVRKVPAQQQAATG